MRDRDDSSGAPHERSGGGEQQPLLLRAAEAAELLGVGRSTFFRLDIKGEVPRPVHIGRMRRWPQDELRRWVAAGCPPRHVWEEVNA